MCRKIKNTYNVVEGDIIYHLDSTYYEISYMIVERIKVKKKSATEISFQYKNIDESEISRKDGFVTYKEYEFVVRDINNKFNILTTLNSGESLLDGIYRIDSGYYVTDYYLVEKMLNDELEKKKEILKEFKINKPRNLKIKDLLWKK